MTWTCLGSYFSSFACINCLSLCLSETAAGMKVPYPKAELLSSHFTVLYSRVPCLLCQDSAMFVLQKWKFILTVVLFFLFFVPWNISTYCSSVSSANMKYFIETHSWDQYRKIDGQNSWGAKLEIDHNCRTRNFGSPLFGRACRSWWMNVCCLATKNSTFCNQGWGKTTFFSRSSPVSTTKHNLACVCHCHNKWLVLRQWANIFISCFVMRW